MRASVLCLSLATTLLTANAIPTEDFPRDVDLCDAETGRHEYGVLELVTEEGYTLHQVVKTAGEGSTGQDCVVYTDSIYPDQKIKEVNFVSIGGDTPEKVVCALLNESSDKTSQQQQQPPNSGKEDENSGKYERVTKVDIEQSVSHLRDPSYTGPVIGTLKIDEPATIAKFGCYNMAG